MAITATQAAERENETQRLHVVATTTVQQGIAAALAFNSQMTAEQNLQAMKDAVSEVVSIEVTRAVRDTTVEGRVVAEGDFMGLVDGDLSVLETSAEAALLVAAQKIGFTREGHLRQSVKTHIGWCDEYLFTKNITSRFLRTDVSTVAFCRRCNCRDQPDRRQCPKLLAWSIAYQ